MAPEITSNNMKNLISKLPTSRHRQDTPPSQTHTPSLKIPGIQGAATELEDSPALSTKSDLGEEPFFTSIGEHIAVKEVESPREEEEVETLTSAINRRTRRS